MKKISFLILTFVSILLYSCGQPTVSGTNTYYFNQEIGFRPDSGTIVYATKMDVSDIENFLEAGKLKHFIKIYERDIIKFERLIEQNEESLKTASADSEKIISERLAKYRKTHANYANTISEFTQTLYSIVADDYLYRLEEEAALNKLVEIKNDEATLSTTADKDGNYSISLPKGEFNLVFVTPNKTRINLPENNGQIFITKVNISGNEIVNAEFER